jgi:hypothetical protein
MKRFLPSAAACAFAWAFLAPAGATTIVVDANGAGDFSEIQPAINLAEDDDEVVVKPGEYVITAPLTFLGKAITVRGDEGAEATTVRMADQPADPERASVVIFESGETEASALEGVTLTGGRGSLIGSREELGGAVLCIDGSSPLLRDCVVTGNSARRGGGLACLESAPTVIDCALAANGGTFDDGVGAGGGVYLNDGAAPVFERCAIERNALAVASPTTLTGGGIYSGASSAVLTGCRVSENTLAAQEGDAEGGGLGIYNGSTVRLEDCDIASNRAEASDHATGGGILLSESTATVENCRVSENTLASRAQEGNARGGGLGVWNESTVSLEECEIASNRVEASRHATGGGMLLFDSTATASRCSFRENSAGREDAEQATAGGVFFSDPRPGTTFTDCTIEGNVLTAGQFGVGAGVFCQAGARPVLTGCRIAGNRAVAETSRGGGMMSISDSAPDMNRCRIVGNSLVGRSEACGGGIFAHGCSPRFTDCLIAGNGGSCEVEPLCGGGVFCSTDCAPALNHCTVTENAGAQGAGVHCIASAAGTELASCIVWGNDGRAIFGAPSVKYSCVEGAALWPGEGNTNEDPLFCSPGRWEEDDPPDSPAPLWIEGDYGLAAASPCRGAGEGGSDMGAELGMCDGDGLFRRGYINADENMDLSDAVFILGYLFAGGEAPGCLKSADVDDNGELQITDAIFLLGHLFLGGPSPAQPFPDCGSDLTADGLSCLSFPACR